MMETCGSKYNADPAYNNGSDVISYSSTGSGTGKTNFANGTYKFGGSESSYSSGAPANFVYVPLIAGPIGIAYRLDGVTPAGSTVSLSADTVAKIFAGTITMWNDPAIVAENTVSKIAAVKKTAKNGAVATAAKAGNKVNLKLATNAAGLKKFKGKKVTITRTTLAKKVTDVLTAPLAATLTKSVNYSKDARYDFKIGTTSLGSVTVDDTIIVPATLTLPATPIRVAYRSGTSGTTNMFTNYLNKTIPAIWSKPANDAFTTAFPTSIPTNGTFQAASGNDGVTNLVKTTNGAITYAELSFIKERESAGVLAANVKNNGGRFVAPSTNGAAVFYAEAVVEADGLVTADYSVASLDAYPINAIAYGLASKTASVENTGVKNFFSYFLNVCSPQNAASKYYAALNGSILTKAVAQVGKISAG
jgi:ABC-type phosphate transport system substrate-binding protein